MLSTTPLLISASQVYNVLSWPMVIFAVEEAMKAATQHTANENGTSYYEQSERLVININNGTGFLLAMYGFVGNYQLKANALQGKKSAEDESHPRLTNTIAFKLATSFDNKLHDPPLPSIIANILLFSPTTGQLLCVMDGTQITAWRTAAASIVATEYLYFKRSGNKGNNKSIQLAIIGCGTQGISHALGMCATYNVSDVYLWNRTPRRAHALADKLHSIPENANVKVHVVKTAAEAVATADVICVGTSSDKALFSFEMLQKSNVHINSVGYKTEVAQNIYDNAKVYVDSWAGIKDELKDLKANFVDEIGHVIRTQRYPPHDGITIFPSLGLAGEDATVAQAVYDVITKTNTK